MGSVCEFVIEFTGACGGIIIIDFRQFKEALQLVLAECRPKAKIVDICEKGDLYITTQTSNMYKNVKKKVEKGIAFLTCLSVNNTVCHFSPLASDENVLEEGDVLKIDMGCHIDGFIAVVAHTHVLQQGKVTGRVADVLAAANTAAEVALRLVRPGKKNKEVTEAIQKVAAAYDCKVVEGVLSHQLKQFVIDGNKVVLSVPNADTRVDEAEFEENEVYAVDIVASSGDGKPKMLDEKQTTVYKRAVDQNYHLKMKASRFIFSEISQKFPIMPFTARALEEKRARFGLVECVNHDLLRPYPVLHEKPGTIVAHIKFTVLLMPNGSDRVTSHPVQELEPTKTHFPVSQPTKDPAKPIPIPPYMKAISGSIGGIVEASCLQPIDVIKTRLQLDRTGSYKGIVDCGRTVVKTEGVKALWKGLTPFATHLTLKYALRMGSNAVLQSAFKDDKGFISNQGRIISGFGAGVLEALVIVTPFEVVKIRLQQQKGLSTELLKYKGPIHCAGVIIHEDGLRGLWAGASPTIMRNGTNQAAMFTAKNAFDKVLWKKLEGDGRLLLPWQSMISGFLAGIAGPVCTGPFDVVKTRLMAQSRSDGNMKYTGMFHAIKTIYAEEGLLALWKGLLPRLMRIPPGQAIMWGVADQVIGFYEKTYINKAPL